MFCKDVALNSLQVIQKELFFLNVLRQFKQTHRNLISYLHLKMVSFVIRRHERSDLYAVSLRSRRCYRRVDPRATEACPRRKNSRIFTA